MSHPLYNPETAFGNIELIKICPEVVETEEPKEEGPQPVIGWSVEVVEYSTRWKCECGTENEDTSDYEAIAGDEVECFRCQKTFVLA